MPTTKSAKKALKRSLVNRSRNRHFSELYKEAVKFLERAIAAKADDLGTLLSKVYSAIDTLAKKNIIHKNNAARKKSMFSKLVKATGSDQANAPKAVKKAAPAKKPAAAKAPAKAAKEAAPKAEKKAPAKKPAAKKASA